MNIKWTSIHMWDCRHSEVSRQRPSDNLTSLVNASSETPRLGLCPGWDFGLETMVFAGNGYPFVLCPQILLPSFNSQLWLLSGCCVPLSDSSASHHRTPKYRTQVALFFQIRSTFHFGPWNQNIHRAQTCCKIAVYPHLNCWQDNCFWFFSPPPQVLK